MKAIRITLAIILTLLVVFSSYWFGPNRRYKVEARCPQFAMAHKAPRGHDGGGAAELELNVKLCRCTDSDVKITLAGRVKGVEKWEYLDHQRIEPGEQPDDRIYFFSIPEKPWTTRYFYKFEGRLTEDGPNAEPRLILERENGDPMMIKFKGAVPGWILILHILAMFGGFCVLILSVFHAIAMAAGRGKDNPAAAGRLGWMAWLILFIGGLPLGCAMNYYAFNVYWEAWPFGGDVTDNKTQIALIIWGIATYFLMKKPSKKAGIVGVLAGLVVLAIFLIPHSAQI